MMGRLKDHDALLRERVFQVDTKWPQFRLLLADIDRLSNTTAEGATVVSLERGMLYGGYSLIGPYFYRQHFLGVDCSPDSAEERGGYNKSMVDDPRLVKVHSNRRVDIHATGLDSSCADLVIIPNLVHHVADQEALFDETARILKPGGRLYVFEPLLRELHQEPDDYLRYTPYGIRRIVESKGYKVVGEEREGNVFSAIAYCWTQALEYFPEPQRREMTSWFYENHFPQLLQWDEQCPRNLVRKHTSFPTAFSILAEKSGEDRA